MHIDIDGIFDYLHRYPFCWWTELPTLWSGAIHGYKNVTFNEEMFSGHFPGKPMPGVLILEAMAQISGILAFETRGSRPSDGKNYCLEG